MQSDFSLFVEQLVKNEQKASERLRFVIQQVIKQWMAKTKNETNWLAENNRAIQLENISDRLLKEVVPQITDGLLNDYRSLRQFITSRLESIARDGFCSFCKMLCKGNNQAWGNLSETLKIRCLPWFYRRNIKDYNFISDTFNDSLTLLYEKLSSGELKFSDAIALKSYYFRILEYKIMEYRRLQLSHSELTEATHNIDTAPDPYLPIVAEETGRIIEQAIAKLDNIDKDIIISYYYYGERLNAIAARTGLSEENVRVRKHRALGFLMKILKEEGYETLVYTE